jgi:hypothetical protein
MDITDTSPLRMAAGIDDLYQGKGVTYESVHFWRDITTRPPVLHVSSYSEYIHLETVTPGEAEKQIDRSKAVATDLADKNARFRELWLRDKKAFHFCYDYGKGGVEVAEEVDGQLEWKK